MSWAVTILIAILCAAGALFGAGYIAHRACTWYSIPAREGQSGYFVVFMAMLGGFLGLIIGLIASRVAYAQNLGGWGALGCSLGVVAIALLAALVISYLRGDIPPTVKGRTLTLQVEFRSPPGDR